MEQVSIVAAPNTQLKTRRNNKNAATRIKQYESAYKIRHNVKTKKMLMYAMKGIAFRREKYVDSQIQIHDARVIYFDHK